MALNSYQIQQSLNGPTGSDFMDATAGPTYIVNEFTDIKSTVRTVNTMGGWASLVGLRGSGWTGGLAWTITDGTHATIQGNQLGYLTTGQRVRALFGSGAIIYGAIAAISTTATTNVTFLWDTGALDGSVTDIQYIGGPQAVPQTVYSQYVNPTYCIISNSGGNWTGTLSPPITSYVAGVTYYVQWNGPSVGNDTVNLNGLGARTILRRLGTNAFYPLNPYDVPGGALTPLYFDGTNLQLDMPTSHVVVPNRLIGNPAIDLINSNATTPIYSWGMPANWMGPYTGLRLAMDADLLNNSGTTQSVNLNISFGGVTLFTNPSPRTFSSSANRYAIHINMRITNLGATNRQYAQIGLLAGEAAPSGQISTISANSPFSGGWSSSTVDTTVPQNLVFQAQLSVANPNLELRVYAVVVEQLLP